MNRIVKKSIRAFDCDKSIVIYSALFICIRAIMILEPISLVINETKVGKIFKALVYAIGFGLLTIDWIKNRKILTGKNIIWLLGLVISLVVSECIHYQYASFTELVKQGLKSGILVFVLYTVGMRMARNEQIQFMRTLHNVLSIIFIPSIFYMFYQFLTLQHYVVNAIHQGWYEGRLFGILISPYSGAMIIALLAFGACFLFHFSNGKKYKVLYSTELVIYFIFLALSDTRTAYVACAAGLGFILFWHCYKSDTKSDHFRRIGRGFLAFLLITAAMFALLKGIRTASLYCARELNNQTEPFSEFAEEQDRPPQTFTSRRAFIWESYFDVLTNKPIHILFGLSESGSSSYIRENHPDTYIVDPFKYYYPESFEQGHVYETHNTYLTVFVYTGAFGLIFLLVFLFKGSGSVVKKIIHGTFTPFDALIGAIVLMILTAGFFEADPFFAVTYNSCLFWVCAGFLMNSHKEEVTTNHVDNPILPS